MRFLFVQFELPTQLWQERLELGVRGVEGSSQPKGSCSAWQRFMGRGRFKEWKKYAMHRMHSVSNSWKWDEAKDSTTPRCGTAGVAFAATAGADERELAAFATGVAFVTLHAGDADFF